MMELLLVENTTIAENILSQLKLTQAIIEPAQVLGLSSSCFDLIFTSQPNLVNESGNNANNPVAIVNKTIVNCLLMIMNLLS